MTRSLRVFLGFIIIALELEKGLYLGTSVLGPQILVVIWVLSYYATVISLTYILY